MPVWLDRLLDLPWDTLQLMRTGGKIIPAIAAISLCMWFLILRKLVELHAVRRERMLLDASGNMAPDGPLRNMQGWLAGLVSDFHGQRTHDTKGDKRLLCGLLQKKSAEAGRYVPTILVLASIAPLLGLLGTVAGMISTFDAITLVGTGNPRPMASGISEALITTLYGLAVAIPGVMMGNYLNRRVQRFQIRLEEFGLRLCRLYGIEGSGCAKTQGEES